MKWALAGRNQERLEKVRLDLSEQYGSELQEVPILLGDIKDQVSKAAGNSSGSLLSLAAPCASVAHAGPPFFAGLPVLHQ